MGKSGKFLRITAIILMGITSAHILLGASGSVCISWFPEQYESLVNVVPYKGIYQIATSFTFVAAFIGIWSVVGLVRGKSKAYTLAVSALILSIVTALTKMYYSNMLRGSTMPTDIRLYLSIFTLLYFLMLRLPGIKDKVDLTKSGKNDSSGTGAGTGMAMVLAGIAFLTTHLWAGPSHMMDGRNLVLVLDAPLTYGGIALLVGGVVFLLRIAFAKANAPQKITEST